MTLRILSFVGFLVLLFPYAAASHWSRRHQEVAHRARGDVDIHKRQYFSGARFTFYDVGLGACGITNVPSDWIVALNSDQYGTGYPGPQCFKSITIRYNGVTAVATITDECPGCPHGGLDFSRGLFDHFADESVGVLYGEWWFNDGSGGSGDQTTSTAPTTTWEQPTTTSTPDYTPPPTTSSTTYYAPTTTSTSVYTPPSTTSSTFSTSSTSVTSPNSSTSTSTPTSSNHFSTGSSSGLAVPTGMVSTPDTTNPENILVINDILIELGVVLSAAEKN